MVEVRLDVDLEHPSDRVWRALTDRDVLDRWFLPGGWAVAPGAAYQLRPGRDSDLGGPIDVEVLEVTQGRRLAMQWSGPTLFTEMVWSLLPRPAGCRLSITQTGFMGTPQTLRVEHLRREYQDMFGRALPAVLAATALAAPAAGRGARGSGWKWASRGPAEMSTARRVRDRAGRWIPPWEVWATVAAALAVAAFAALSVLRHPGLMSPQPPAPLGSGPTRLDVLPRTVAPAGRPTVPVAQGGAPSARGPVPAVPAARAAGVPAQGVTGTATGTVAVPDAAGTPTPLTVPVPAPARLTATYQTLNSKGKGNGFYDAQVSLAAPGSGGVNGWTVVITVPAGASVKQTSGAAEAQNGQTVTFTPAGDAQVPAGQVISFSFRVHKPAGTDQPLSCALDGRPCAGLP